MTEVSQTSPAEQSIKGRSVFLVETTPAGIAVQTALLTEDGQLLNAPAIFPDVEYAFAQVDDLKRLISAHFSQAARLGAQVAAQQVQANASTNAPQTETPTTVVATQAAAEPDPAADAAPAQESASGGRKTLENLKKFVYSGLSQVSKITQASSTATPTPENTQQVETTADPIAVNATAATASVTARKPRSGGKKAKTADSDT